MTTLRRNDLSVSRRAALVGAIGSATLLGLYLAVIGFVQGPRHAVEQLLADGPFVAAVAAGFGIQVALFVELRSVHGQHKSAAAVTAAGTGTSSAAMLACCAHHLVDVLPLVGLSAAALFLDAYKTPLLLLGIGMNVVGIAVVARQLVTAREACATAGLDAGVAHAAGHPAH